MPIAGARTRSRAVLESGPPGRRRSTSAEGEELVERAGIVRRVEHHRVDPEAHPRLFGSDDAEDRVDERRIQTGVDAERGCEVPRVNGAVEHTKAQEPPNG